MAILSAASQALLKDPIDLLLKGTAREWPLSQDVLQRIAVFTDAVSGIGSTSGLVFEAGRDVPVSLLIGIVAEVGYPILSAVESAQLVSAFDLLRIGTAYETPFAEDVIERLAPAAESSGFLSKGGFYEAIRDRPVSTMLQWALFLGSK